MTDRELLGLAAKAAGIPLKPDFAKRYDYYMADPLMWNPLKNDGDALRLAVKLEIDLSFYSERDSRVYAQTKHLLGFGTDDRPAYQAHEYMKEPYGGDPFAATRRAIVRAAAAIGANDVAHA